MSVSILKMKMKGIQNLLLYNNIDIYFNNKIKFIRLIYEQKKGE